VYCILPYVVQFLEVIVGGQDMIQLRSVFLNRWAAAWYRALASIIPGH